MQSPAAIDPRLYARLGEYLNDQLSLLTLYQWILRHPRGAYWLSTRSRDVVEAGIARAVQDIAVGARDEAPWKDALRTLVSEILQARQEE